MQLFKMCSSIVSCTLAVLLVGLASVNCEIPSYIKVCPHDHQDFTGCIIDSIEHLKPKLKAGIPEINVQPLEPLQLGRIEATLGEGSTIATNLTDINLWGASNFKILKLTHKLRKNGHSFQFEVLVPQLRVEGHYEIDSKVLFLNLQGQGPFTVNFTDYHFECLMKGDKVNEAGVNHLIFGDLKCNAVYGELKINLENLFGGNQVLGQAANAVINDNSKTLFTEISPRIRDKIRAHFKDIANQITRAFAYEELFP